MQIIELRSTVPLLLFSLTALPAIANDGVIRFDMAPTVAARPADPPTIETTATTILDDGVASQIVQCELRLSSLIASPSVPQIDQWLVQCTPRDPAMRLVDYSPRTELSSGIEGPIQFKITDEESSSLGLNVNSSYGSIAHGNVGADSGKKNLVTQQYNQIAAVQAVTASGTINRGQGVYFKLRWTATQVLEGEKVFKLSLRVPRSWRGGLIDVNVTAQSAKKTFGGFDTQIKTLGAADFVVAAYRSGDTEATQHASELMSAEQHLRHVSRRLGRSTKPTSLPSMLRHVAAKFDLDEPPRSGNWIGRLTAGQIDPYIDREINRLPMDVRIAAIEYHDKRVAFKRLTNRSNIANSTVTDSSIAGS